MIMKAEVIKLYVEKSTKQYCKPGSIVEYDEARVKYLIELGFVKAVTEDVEKTESAKATKTKATQ